MGVIMVSNLFKQVLIFTLDEEENSVVWNLQEGIWGYGDLESSEEDFLGACADIWGSNYVVSTRQDEELLQARKNLFVGCDKTLLVYPILKQFAYGPLPEDKPKKFQRLRHLAKTVREAIESGSNDLCHVIDAEGWGLFKMHPTDCSAVHYYLCNYDKKDLENMATSTDAKDDSLLSKAQTEKFPELQTNTPFHEDGKLPPAEERKDIVRKIRARTLSRASQSGSPSTVTSPGLFSHPSPTLLEPQVPSIGEEAQSILSGPKQDNNDAEDTSWMHSDGSDPKSSKKKKGKSSKKKKKTTEPTLRSSSDDLPVLDDEAQLKAMENEVEADSEVQAHDGTVLPGGEVEDEIRGEWLPVWSKSKPKKKEEIKEKGPNHVSGAKSWQKKKEEIKEKDSNNVSGAKAWPKKLELSKSTSQTQPKQVASGIAKPKEEFRFQEEEFPDLHNPQPISRNRSGPLLSLSTPTTPNIPSAQATYDIIARGSSQKALKQQLKSAKKTNEVQTPPAAREVIPQTEEHTSTMIEESTAERLRVTSSSSDPGFKKELSSSKLTKAADMKPSVPVASTSTTSKYVPAAMPISPWKSIQSVSREEKLPNSTSADSKQKAAEASENSKSDHTVESAPSIVPETLKNEHTEAEVEKDTDSDHESRASDLTAVPGIEEIERFKSERFPNQYLAKDLTQTGSVAKIIEHGRDSSRGTPKNSKQPRRESDESTVYTKSAFEATSLVPHPFTEHFKSVAGEWVSDPGNITIDGMDAREVLGEHFPRGLTIQDHPDVNIFSHSDWITCAYCDSFIRERGRETEQRSSVPVSGALICRRCGPCSLTRYCSRGCLLNDLSNHWDKCASDSIGIFPLDWSSVPKHYYDRLPALGTWSSSSNYHHTRERARQMTYIAELHKTAVPHVRMSYFDKLLKTGPKAKAKKVKHYFTTSSGAWDKAQESGDYFFFIDHEYIDERKHIEETSGFSGPFKTIAESLVKHKNSEGLCPATAVPLQLPAYQRPAFSRLVHTCFVTNNTKLVEYLWHWIRVELSQNLSIAQWCFDNGTNTATIFLLWVPQFEKEFGLSPNRQSAMLNEAAVIPHHPYSTFWSEPWPESLAGSSIHSLIYEHEMWFPILRAWRRPEQRYTEIPQNPWARLRGDGFANMVRPDGVIVTLNNPDLPWSMGWNGMPPYIWKEWLVNMHIILVRKALDEFVAAQENVTESTKDPSQNNTEASTSRTTTSTVKKIARDYTILHNGKEMESVEKMESRLKTMFNEKEPRHRPQLNLENRTTHHNKSDASIASFDGTTESADNASKRSEVSTNGSVINKSILNPAVAEFRSSSPTKSTNESAALTETMLRQTKPLATDADKWLASKGTSLANPSTSTATATAAPESSSSTTNIEDIHARWHSAELAYSSLVREEIAKDEARKKILIPLKLDVSIEERKLAIAMRTWSNAQEKSNREVEEGNVRVRDAQVKVEALRKELQEKMPEEMKVKIVRGEERDRVEAERLMKGDEDGMAFAKAVAAAGGTGARGGRGRGGGGHAHARRGSGGSGGSGGRGGSGAGAGGRRDSGASRGSGEGKSRGGGGGRGGHSSKKPWTDKGGKKA